uniref:Homeobox domain-containing protein n=1 Tax=Corethron hystrix TaxID=216773 RepID=A0A7S1BPM6_9STRA|mmetsp:Transcript_3403/g.6300  ORF Transcript_3403/g.6300 Transcript_3403/m.6300 type:complete len:768 (+) Transcript_3403:162-2465(+)
MNDQSMSKRSNFIVSLHQALSPQENNDRSVVVWSSSGDVFIIRDLDRFVNEIASKVCGGIADWNCFKRCLRYCGFKAHFGSHGRSKLAIRHEFFHRDKPELLKRIRNLYFAAKEPSGSYSGDSRTENEERETQRNAQQASTENTGEKFQTARLSLAGASKILKTWFRSHIDLPFPSRHDESALLEQTGLSKNQLRNWFANARQRLTQLKLEKGFGQQHDSSVSHHSIRYEIDNNQLEQKNPKAQPTDNALPGDDNTDNFMKSAWPRGSLPTDIMEPSTSQRDFTPQQSGFDIKQHNHTTENNFNQTSFASGDRHESDHGACNSRDFPLIVEFNVTVLAPMINIHGKKLFDSQEDVCNVNDKRSIEFRKPLTEDGDTSEEMPEMNHTGNRRISDKINSKRKSQATEFSKIKEESSRRRRRMRLQGIELHDIVDSVEDVARTGLNEGELAVKINDCQNEIKRGNVVDGGNNLNLASSGTVSYSPTFLDANTNGAKSITSEISSNKNDCQNECAAKSPSTSAGPCTLTSSLQLSSVPSLEETSVPFLKGTLVANLETRQHIIKGKWNFIGADPLVTPHSDFEFVHNLSPDVKDPSVLPIDGRYDGSFNILCSNEGADFDVIEERDLSFNFIKIVSTDNESSGNYEYSIEGYGSNKFGYFQILGVGEKKTDTDTFSISLRKIYRKEKLKKKSTSVYSLVCKAEGLPAGWLKKGAPRKGGVFKGRLDTYWFNPKGDMFRSRKEIARYMQRVCKAEKEGYNPDIITQGFDNVV